MSKKLIPRFSRKESQEFFKTLNNRVNQYFKDHKIPKTGNWRLYSKTVVMFALLIAPYVLILSLNINDWLKLFLSIITGIGMAGVGMNVMHDGNHGSFSNTNGSINSWVGVFTYLLEMFSIGRFNTTFYIIPIPIFTVMMQT